MDARSRTSAPPANRPAPPVVVPPWASLPESLGPLLRPHLDEVADLVIASVGRDVAEYRRPIEGSFGQGLLSGVRVALDRFLTLPGTTEPALASGSRDIYVGLGRGEVRQGRALTSLLAAYRAGARVAFRSFADIAGAHGWEPAVVALLAESVFAYIDELSAASVEGFAAEQADRAGERERLRDELVGLLLAGGADQAAVQDAARSVGWRLPERMCVVLFSPETVHRPSTRFGRDALVGVHAGRAVAVVPAPSGAPARRALHRTLRGLGAVVGPARGWRELPSSARVAVLASGLGAAGVIDADPLWCDENAAALLVHRDPDLVADLASYRLAPLVNARAASRDRLAETLLAWLAFRGERTRVAEELNVHPQTVGYRLGQLRELFGPALDDPTARFELELALRATRR